MLVGNGAGLRDDLHQCRRRPDRRAPLGREAECVGAGAENAAGRASGEVDGVEPLAATHRDRGGDAAGRNRPADDEEEASCARQLEAQADGDAAFDATRRGTDRALLGDGDPRRAGVGRGARACRCRWARRGRRRLLQTPEAGAGPSAAATGVCGAGRGAGEEAGAGVGVRSGRGSGGGIGVVGGGDSSGSGGAGGGGSAGGRGRAGGGTGNVGVGESEGSGGGVVGGGGSGNVGGGGGRERRRSRSEAAGLRARASARRKTCAASRPAAAATRQTAVFLDQDTRVPPSFRLMPSRSTTAGGRRKVRRGSRARACLRLPRGRPRAGADYPDRS